MSPREKGRKNIGCWLSWTPAGYGRLCFRWPLGKRGKIYRITTDRGRDGEAELIRIRNLIGAEIHAGTFVPEKRFPSAFAPRVHVDSPIERKALVERMRAWIADREKRRVRLSRTTGYASHLRTYIARAPMLRDADLSALTSSDVLGAFQTWLVSEGGAEGRALTEKTAANVIRGTLRAFARDQRLPLDAFDELRWERYTPTREQDPFTAEDRDTILGWFRSRRPFEEYVSIRLRFVGISPSEVRGLNVGDFDRPTGTVRIARSRHLGAEGATKTRARERLVWLGPVAADVAALVGVRDRKEPLLRVAEDTLRDNFTKAQKALGIRERSLYQAKHTFATLELERGESPARVAKNLGISLATLEKHYARALQSGRLDVQEPQRRVQHEAATPGNANLGVVGRPKPVSTVTRRKHAR